MRIQRSLLRAAGRRGAFLATAALLTAAGCASSKTLGSSLDDFTASQTVRTNLFADRQHDYGDIDITMYEGRLMLTGTMRTEDGRQRLVSRAWKADNVRQVVDEIVVSQKTRFGQGLADTRIDQSVKSKLLGDRGVTSGDFKLAVSNGVVFILGVARDQIELDRVLNHARSTSGVKKVVSHVIYQDDPARLSAYR
ncbi:MAG: BON domain-containing protein [Pseudomonadota bacterium]